MNKKYDNNNIIIASRAYFLQTSGGDSLSGRVPGRASGPSRSRIDDGDGSRCISGKLIGSLGFSHRGVFIGEGAVSEVDQRGLTHRGRGQGLGRASSW
jgi:hypothetical protein